MDADAASLIACLREKHAEAGKTLLKLERSIALRMLHPELEKHTRYTSVWEQTNHARYNPKYALVVRIYNEALDDYVRTTHSPADVPEPLLKTMPNYDQYKRREKKDG